MPSLLDVTAPSHPSAMCIWLGGSVCSSALNHCLELPSVAVSRGLWWESSSEKLGVKHSIQAVCTDSRAVVELLFNTLLGLLRILCLVLVPTFSVVLVEISFTLLCPVLSLVSPFCPNYVISEARTPLSVHKKYSEVGTEQSYCGLLFMKAVTFEWMQVFTFAD